MKSRKYFEPIHARIEIIPMIDIMMFLLVFFMVVTLRMIAGSGIKLDLPHMLSAQDLNPPFKLTVSVRRDGALFVDQQQLSGAALTGRLQEMHTLHPQIEVIIAADENALHKNVMTAMDAVRLAGIDAVGIAAQQDRAAQ
jgi:biopolymer transport protein ExbD